jgi:hypothetical protein
MATTDLWSFGDQSLTGLDLTGHEVEATDGPIGKIDMATHDVGASYIVVDTGIWKARGSRVVIPAAAIERQGAGKVYLNRSRKDIENAPPFDGKGGFDAPERAMLDSYYRASFYAQEPWAEASEEPPMRSRDELYEEAKELGVEGRSNMSKSQLEHATNDARKGR